MTPEQLLQECERLNHVGRTRRMVELGRLAASDASVSETIATLTRGNVYERVLAVQSCHGSRDSKLILHALSDPSLSVRKLATSIAALVCGDAELPGALDTLPQDLRDVLLTTLAQRSRQAPVDAYIEMLATRHDTYLKNVLPFASQEVVTRHLGQVIEAFGMVQWKRLTRYYPAIAVAQLQARATTADGPNIYLVQQVNEVMPLLARLAPDLGLDLVRTMASVFPLNHLSLQPLLERRPAEVVDLVIQAGVKTDLEFDDIAHRLDSERLVTLFTSFPDNISTEYFPQLRPEQRLATYTACHRGWRDEDSALPYEVVAHLPTEQRVREGRRHLELPALQADPSQRLQYAAALPWDEARAALASTLNTPDADLRILALQALITTARYQRDHLADVLQLVRARRNEQDPVRYAMLAALVELPRSIWHAEHLSDLARIIQDTLDARDLSAYTASQAERIILQLFAFHPQWCAEQLAIFWRARGNVTTRDLQDYLTEAHVRLLAVPLLPILQAWQKQERESQLLNVARALGRRFRVFNELADILASLLDHTRSASTISGVISVFADHMPERLSILVPRLVEQDPSSITIFIVYNYLHAKRQDLLTPFLGQNAFQGRFGTGKTRFVMGIRDGFYRWTPTQQEFFALTLLEISRDNERATASLTNVIDQLAAMPALDPAYIIPFASDERSPMRDSALQALGKLDAGQGIPTLLEALNDQRARVAVYSLRGALLAMPQSQALNILRSVPFERVTVAKEAIRLIGELETEEAYRELLILNERDLHRDARVALLRALWPYVEHAETWEIFAGAARSTDVAIAKGVIHVPSDGMSPQAQGKLASLIASLLDHPDIQVRMETLKRCLSHPVNDAGRACYARLLALMDSTVPRESSFASRVVFETYTGRDAELVGETMRTLLPNRRALNTACNNFLSALPGDRKALEPTSRAILAVLAQDHLTISLRIRLVVTGLPWEEIAPEVIRLSSELHADALAQAEQAIEQAATRADADLVRLESALAGSNDERLRRLALVALIAQTQQASGWSEEVIARLNGYRADPSPLVAEQAQFTFVP
ncbi:hypothetical protein [Ktedonobacter racemifer]|uniref:HEAT repeat domain-containing protein n=1 Tax=Ktedonobacter racemifer DSM 44963 TaxID=485913 RepID=D6U035_KTERA|nr:hypothetical protein [Ktedonobacter racemifer]EFH82175.1 conserved hypothetical protein [Ktedonobacter racemifer DSM 44963]